MDYRPKQIRVTELILYICDGNLNNMYGLVNKAIKDLVVNNYGEETWKEIASRANFQETEFVGLQSYPDTLTYDLVKHASEVLKADPHDILEAFGEYWITYTASEGYGELMDLSGNTFSEFLSNLDMLHSRMSNMMPHLAPPQFTTRNEKENSLELEYRSERQGLSPMLFGLIRGLGKRFNLNCTIKQIVEKGEHSDCHVYLIEW
ncbi:MAG: hypothetical protein RLZ10_2080 [Bacteroidota bacterium]